VIQEISAEERMNILAELQNNPEGAAAALAALRRGESPALQEMNDTSSDNRERPRRERRRSEEGGEGGTAPKGAR
jgi:hypothetical protein